MFFISTLLKYIRNTVAFWSLLLILAVLALGRVVDFQTEKVQASSEAVSFGLGGPVEVLEENAGFFLGQSAPANSVGESEDSFLVFEGAVLLGTSYPLSNVIPSRDGLQKYKVQEGDTLSGIAARFGITLSTIKWANPGARTVIRPGEELVILPVPGILYTVKDGDSLETIARRYQLDPETIKDYNPGYQQALEDGGTLVLPYAKPIGSSPASAENLPNLGNYFILPARGWNWARLHDYNAVDIADQCGKPIYASADGLVIEESDEGYWNQGYGNYVLIEHANGSRTRYAHTDKNLVKVGDYVSQGDQIALIGNTGNTHGPTGCHLHFEVHGGRNPFAVR